MRLAFTFSTAVALLVSATAASAAIVDPAGDFLPTYTGPTNSDVDILSTNVGFDNTNFYLSATESGSIGSTANSLFVWAVDRGSGIARPALAPPAGASLLWDAVIVMFPDGTLRVVTFPTAGAPTITNMVGGTSVAGSSLSAVVAAALLPSTGFDPTDYTFSFWSRVRVTPGADGLNSEVADLLAGSGSIRAAAVPEPATWLTMLLGFGAAGAALRSRRKKLPQVA
jgi:hypothetical protein